MADQVDVVDAVITLLLADADVAAIAGTDVYDELPALEGPAGDDPDPTHVAFTMPRPCIVISGTGGGGGLGEGSWVEETRDRLDVKAYGVLPADARQLAMLVRRRLRAVSREVWAGVLLREVTPSGGVQDLTEPDVDWPVSWTSYVIDYSEVPVE